MSDPGVILAVPDALVDAIARRVVQLMPSSAGAPVSPWLDVDQAADYLRCKPQRIYDLVAAGELRPAKDGRRSLFRREWLDAYLSRSEAA